ncbi:MAG: hypothetical protein ABIF84_01320 [Patescibacteria group bacterium]
MDKKKLAGIIEERGRPRCVALMADGTRRMLKLEPGYHQDKWLYARVHINKMMEQVMLVVDFLFEVGVEVIIGPLASQGNIHRPDFLPKGLEILLDSLFEPFSLEVFKKRQVAVSFYGDLDYVKSLPGGEIIEFYQYRFQEMNPATSKHRILIGIGFSTDRETEIIARLAIDFYQRYQRPPSYSELVVEYFGADIPVIDIFIRTNEMRASGGLTPLLTGLETQWYVPVAPGILSFSEKLIRLILCDYFCHRVISKGIHNHEPIILEEAVSVSDFYQKHSEKVLGLGFRVGDIWLPDL